jgi:transcriptional regulator with XRE-family HTH domain
MPQNKLADIRRAKDKSLLDFYRETGIPVYHFSDIERGKTLPTIDEMDKLAELYGIDAQEVYEIVHAKEEGK